MKNIQILTISGSLRAKSSNTTVSKALEILPPAATDITFYSELANLPHFNPDLDCEPLPDFIKSLRQQVKSCDGMIISSPEYAHGVPGSLKNLLDWPVSSVEFPGKPVAIINTNPRATLALASLKEILITMSARIVEPANVTLSIAGRNLNAKEIAADSELSRSLKQAIAIFTREIASSTR